MNNEDTLYVDNPKFNHISLCAGYAGVDIALKRAIPSLRTIAVSEIEAFACANLVAKMEAGLLDAAPIWTDLRTFPFRQFHGMVDILSGGFPCFAAGTQVLTKRGYIGIESVVVGDSVLTHRNRWQKVSGVMLKKDARIFEVTNGITVKTTSEHPFYSKHRTVCSNKRIFSESSWLEAGKLSCDDFLAVPIPECCDADENTEQFWYVVGRYLGDGWRTISNNKGRVVICTSYPDADELEQKIKSAGFAPCRSEERTCVKFHITRKFFYDFLEQFGTYSDGKTMAGIAFGLSQAKTNALLQGYLDADGHRSRSGWRVGSVSRSLAFGVFTLATKAFGVVPSIRLHQPSRKNCTIEGRNVKEKQRWVVDIPDRNKCSFIEGGYGWRQVKGAKTTDIIADVYNISVDEDESYIADGYVVHNCQPFSQAGKRAGDEDPRHLFPHILRGITECQPNLVFLENVEGIISAKLKGDGWRDPAGTPVLLHVLRELERVGYRATAGVFSSVEIGASHQRKRVYILAMVNPANDGCSSAERSGCARSGENKGWVWKSQRMGSSQWNVCLRPKPPGSDQWWWEPSRVLHNFTRIANRHGSRLAEARSLADARRGQSSGRQNSAGAERSAQGESGEAGSMGDSTDLLCNGGDNHTRISLERRQIPESGNTGGAVVMADDPCYGRGEGWTESGGEQGRLDAAECGEPAVENPQRSDQEGWSTAGGETQSGRPHSQFGGSGRQTGSTESPLGGISNGSPDWLDYTSLCQSVDSRVDELRLLGNGVDPDVAAKAFVTLFNELTQNSNTRL